MTKDSRNDRRLRRELVTSRKRLCSMSKTAAKLADKTQKESAQYQQTIARLEARHVVTCQQVRNLHRMLQDRKACSHVNVQRMNPHLVQNTLTIAAAYSMLALSQVVQ